MANNSSTGHRQRQQDRDSTRMFLSRRDLSVTTPQQPNSSLVWTTNTSSNDHQNQNQNQNLNQHQLYGSAHSPAMSYHQQQQQQGSQQALFPYRTSQRPQYGQNQLAGSFVNVNNINHHQNQNQLQHQHAHQHRLVSDYATPSIVNLNVTYDMSGNDLGLGSGTPSSTSGRSSRLSGASKSLQSESHIYSHICESTGTGNTNSSCYCPACPDPRQVHPSGMLEHQDLLSPAVMSAMTSMPPSPLYETRSVSSKLAAQVCGQQSLHLPFPYQVSNCDSADSTAQFTAAQHSFPSTILWTYSAE